jgi:c-di-GMP-binding flagellar brake protein YcgR
MAQEQEAGRRLILEAGYEVFLRPEPSAAPLPTSIRDPIAARVDQVDHGVHWFLGSCAPFARGELVRVETAVANDARYATQARVEASSPETFALRIEPLWHRVQERAFVRIAAHGMQVCVLRTQPSDEDPAPDEVCELLDLSAGGLRFKSKAHFETDEEIVCRLELSGDAVFTLPARIVRGTFSPRPEGTPPGVAVEFTQLDEEDRSQILRWIYAEQVRRHRLEVRAARQREARKRR